jgi:hypothetical protein
MSSLKISGHWCNPAIRRCDCKRAFPNWEQAEIVAERHSLKTGELIIAYQCYDCLKFHVGHADESQKIVRQVRVNIPPQRMEKPLPVNCPLCSQPIPSERREAAEKSGSSTVYCSIKCKKMKKYAQRGQLNRTDPMDPMYSEGR